MWRYPSNPAANFEFRVLPLKVVSVSLPESVELLSRDWRVDVHVRDAAMPQGEVVVRTLSAAVNGYSEKHVPLQGHREANAAAMLFALDAELPALQPGQIADFFFRLRSHSGLQVTIPPDAPATLYSRKRPLKFVRSLAGDVDSVLSAERVGSRTWVGLKGGGLSICEMGRCEVMQATEGLPSNVVHFVAADRVGERIYAGTDRGVVEVDPQTHALRALTALYPTAWNSNPDVFSELGDIQRAGPAAISPLDGTLFFQLQGQPRFEQAYPPAVFLELRAGKMSRWIPPGPLVGLSSLDFDASSGCWLLGGFTPAPSGLHPLIIRRCGETLREFRADNFAIEGVVARPTRIIAVTRDPIRGDLLVALEADLLAKGRLQTKWRIFRLKEKTGSWIPDDVGPGDVEITSMVSDWQRRRVLVGTYGKGLYELQNGLRPVTNDLPTEITSISLSQDDGTI